MSIPFLSELYPETELINAFWGASLGYFSHFFFLHLYIQNASQQSTCKCLLNCVLFEDQKTTFFLYIQHLKTYKIIL